MLRRINIVILLVLLLVFLIAYDFYKHKSSKNNVGNKYVEDEFDDFIKVNCPVANNSIAYSCLNSLSKYELIPKIQTIELQVIYYHTFWRVDEEKGSMQCVI